MAFPASLSPRVTPLPCPHQTPSSGSASSNEEAEDLHWPPCFRTHLNTEWMIRGVTSTQKRRFPIQNDALLIRLLPIFLPPRDAPHHKDFVNLPLEGSSCLLPVTKRTSRAILPTFWVRRIPTCRVSPQDLSVIRLIVWLLNWQFEEWTGTWGYIPDFLLKWEESKRRITAFPLVSVLCDPLFPRQTAYSLASSATSPILYALDASLHPHSHDAIDIAPLLCFILGQWCSRDITLFPRYPKPVWRLVLPASLEKSQWQHIQHVNEHWSTLYDHPYTDTFIQDSIARLLAAQASDSSPNTTPGHHTRSLLLSDCQLIPPCHLQVLTLYMDSVEGGYCAMVPFFISLIHLHRRVSPANRIAITPSSTLCWFRHQFGTPWRVSRVSSSHPLTYDLVRLHHSHHIPRLNGLYTADCVPTTGGSFANLVCLPLAARQVGELDDAHPQSSPTRLPLEGAELPALSLPPVAEQSLLEGGVLPVGKEENPLPTAESEKEATTEGPPEVTRDYPALRTRKRVVFSPAPQPAEVGKRRPRSPRSAESGVPKGSEE